MALPSLAVVHMAASKHSFVTCRNFNAFAFIWASARAAKLSEENRVKTMEKRAVVVLIVGVLVTENGGEEGLCQMKEDRGRTVVVGRRDPSNCPPKAETNSVLLFMLFS
jgi:hypothetical protein